MLYSLDYSSVCSPSVSCPAVRQFGVLDSIKSSLSPADRTQEKALEHFKQHLERLSTASTWDLNDFLKSMQDNFKEMGVTGWKSYLPGASANSSSAEAELMKKNVKIVEAMTPAERANYLSISKSVDNSLPLFPLVFWACAALPLSHFFISSAFASIQRGTNKNRK